MLKSRRLFLTTNSLLGKKHKVLNNFSEAHGLSWNKAVDICMDDITAKVSQTGGTLAWTEEAALINVDPALIFFTMELEKKTRNSFT